jgi:hypothetical protein
MYGHIRVVLSRFIDLLQSLLLEIYELTKQKKIELSNRNTGHTKTHTHTQATNFKRIPILLNKIYYSTL